MIRFENVTRTYGKKVAVDNLNLVVPEGELFAFLGPNGAGKTTTTKQAVGLLRPSQGTISICGYDVVKQPREAHQLTSYVPDQPHLYDKLTGREFLQFIADMYGLGATRAREGIAREIDTFQLIEFVDQLAESYSHGMKQRLVFAAAMLHEPRVLIVDEPMVGLDPRSIRLVKDILRKKADEGVAVFMSTHTLAVAEEISDRIGIIHEGQLRFVGSLEDLQALMNQHESSLEELFLQLTDSVDELGLTAPS